MKRMSRVLGTLAAMALVGSAVGGCEGGEVIGAPGSPQGSRGAGDGLGPETYLGAGLEGDTDAADTADPSVGAPGPRPEQGEGVPAGGWRLGTLVTDMAVAGDGRVWVAGAAVGGATEGTAGDLAPWLMTAGGDGKGTWGVAALGTDRMVVAGIRGGQVPHGWLGVYDLDGREDDAWQDTLDVGTSWLSRVATTAAGEVVAVGHRELRTGSGAWDLRRTALRVRWQPHGAADARVDLLGSEHDGAWLNDVAVSEELSMAVGGVRTADAPGTRQGWAVVGRQDGESTEWILGPGELWGVSAQPDGSFVAVGETPQGDASDVWLVCLDDQGRPTQTSTLDLDGSDRAMDIVRSAAGTLLLAGSTERFSGDETQRAWVVEVALSDGGTPLLGGRRLGPAGATQSVGFTLVELPTGDLLTGGAGVFGDEQVRGWLLGPPKL